MKMKNVVIIILLTVLFILQFNNFVYGKLNCNMNLKMNYTELSKNQEFVVDVNLYNVQADRGIISLGATLEYDKQSLTLVKMEGQNNWETPLSGTSYNEENGKIAIIRNGLGKSDEIVFRITFKVNEKSKKKLVISLKDIIVADGDKPFKIDNINKNITIKDSTSSSVSVSENNIANGNDISTDVSTNLEQNIDSSMNSNQIIDSEENSIETQNIDTKNGGTLEDEELTKEGIINKFIIPAILGILLIIVVALFIKVELFSKNKKGYHRYK